MFKKFVAKDEISGTSQLKSSVQRGIRTKLIEHYPTIEKYLEQILPKKESIVLIKCKEHVEVLSVRGELVFFRQRDSPWYPTLKLLHKYPFILPHEQVDKGAIRFVLSGANIMCPGLTSPGAKMTPVETDCIVAIMAEGKEHAVSIGLTKMSTQEISEKNKGIGIDNIHYLNDGLWVMNSPFKTFNTTDSEEISYSEAESYFDVGSSNIDAFITGLYSNEPENIEEELSLQTNLEDSFYKDTLDPSRQENLLW